LHGVPVEPERDVVEEQAAVHQAYVDAPFDPVAEGAERAYDIAPVDPEVLREVVSRAGGNADERKPVLAGGSRDHGQGPVAAGHAQGVGAARDRLADDRCEVLARFQDDGVDSLLACVLGERCARGTAAARARVDQQHRPTGRSDRSPGGSERILHPGMVRVRLMSGRHTSWVIRGQVTRNA
jgi:hypothetical protein